MDMPSIISINDFDYLHYKNLVDKCIKQNDTREATLQGDVVKPFINKLCENLDIVDVSYKGPVKGTRTDYHDYLQYCGTYKDKNNNDKPTTPDLVIAKDWNWYNIKNEVDYRAVVEVKSFTGKQPIFNKDFKSYDEELQKQLKRHLSAKKNKKIILTDCLKWEFYISENSENDLIPIKSISLIDFQKEVRRSTWEWKEGRKAKVKNEVINDIFNGDIEYEEDPEEFKELKEYLLGFLGVGFNLA